MKISGKSILTGIGAGVVVYLLMKKHCQGSATAAPASASDLSGGGGGSAGFPGAVAGQVIAPPASVTVSNLNQSPNSNITPTPPGAAITAMKPVTTPTNNTITQPGATPAPGSCPYGFTMVNGVCQVNAPVTTPSGITLPPGVTFSNPIMSGQPAAANANPYISMLPTTGAYAKPYQGMNPGTAYVAADGELNLSGLDDETRNFIIGFGKRKR